MPKVAAIQLCSSHQVDDNLASAGALIAEAASAGAKLIVLPEMFAVMGETATDKVTLKEPENHGKIQSFLTQQAKQHGVWIVGGTIPIACDNPNKVRAASLLINDQGEIVARYDKIHLFDVTLSPSESYKESDTTEPGDTVVVVDSPFGKIGMSVCYDIRFPELFRVMFNRGAEIFVVPTAFTVKTGEAHWEVLCRSRAIENFAYLIGACQGGTHSSGRSTYGHSLIIDPWGSIVSERPNTTPGVIYADIDLSKLHEARRAIPVLQHQTIGFDLLNLNC